MKPHIYWINDLATPAFEEDTNSALWAPMLSMTYIFELFVHLWSFMMNFFFFMSLRSFTIFHAHMAVICRHLCVVMMLSSVYGVCRVIYANNDWNNGNAPDMTYTADDNCVFSTPMPHYMSILFCILPLILVVERSYATDHFSKYEYDNISIVFSILCAILLIPVPILFLWSSYHAVASRNSHVYCELLEIQKTPLQRNVWGMIAAFFNTVMAVMFYALHRRNKVFHDDNVQHNYSTISVRFQLRENLTTCSFLARCHFSIAALLLLPSFLDVYLFSTDDTLLTSMWKRELWYISHPLLYCFYPVYFVKRNGKLYTKLTKYVSSYYYIEGTDKVGPHVKA